MKYQAQKHHRRSIRLPGYDYTRVGAYFITVATYQRQSILGEIENAEVLLTPVGQIVQREWMRLDERFRNIALDAMVVMPNHLHGIILINAGPAGEKPLEALPSAGDDEIQPHPYGASGVPVAPNSIPAILRAFKSAATYRYNRSKFYNGAPLWQRSYYEHIIRNDDELTRIQQYILSNPASWQADQLHPDASANPFNRD